MDRIHGVKRMLVMLVGMLATLTVSADVDFYVDGFGYEIYETYYDSQFYDRKAVILADGSQFTGKELLIPSKVAHDGTEYWVVGIGRRAFMWNNYIEKVVLPESMERIGMESFEGCNYIRYVNFPQSVKEIGQAAFKGCVRLGNVKLPSVMQAIRREAFSGCTNMTKFTFPLSLETLESYELLANCFSLKEVKFPLRSFNDVYGDSVLVGHHASYPHYFTKTFINCKNLRVVELTGGRWTTGWTEFFLDRAFDGCESLEKIRLVDEGDDPPMVNDAFSEDQYNSITLEVPAGKVEAYSNAEVWKRFKHITSFAEDMTTGDSGECGADLSYNFDKASGSLTISGSGDTDNYDFTFCNSPWYPYRELVQSVTIDEDVTAIGNALFKDCVNMTTVNIPRHVDNIGMFAFENCKSLLSVEIPEGVTELKNSLFYGCSSLTSIVIPKNVTAIGHLVFTGCTGLTSLTCLNPNPPACYGLDVDFTIPLYVPKGSVLKYKAADGWRNFVIIREATEGDESHDIWLTVNDGAHGSLRLKLDEERPYATFQFVAEEGWHVYSVMLGEEDVTAELSADGTYTTPAINADTHLTVVYAEGSTGLTRIYSDSQPKVLVSDSALTLSGLSDGDRLEVYTLDGRRIYSGRATSSQTEIPVTPNQVYIVRINALSLKVCL